jgi:hypothetical protein
MEGWGSNLLPLHDYQGLTPPMNLRDILSEYGVPFSEGGGGHRHVMSGYLGMDCPRCSPGSGKFKLGYSLAGNFLTCWTCGYLPLLDTVQELTGAPWAPLKEQLGALVREKRTERLTNNKVVLPWGVGDLLHPHLSYLQSRGWPAEASRELQRLWGLGGIGLAPKLAWRLFLPIYYRGEVVSWTTRALGDRGLRYVAARPDQEKYKAHDLLFGQDMVRDTLVLVEGPLDVYRIGPGAAATMTTSYSRSQIEKMVGFPTRVVCFDSDRAGQDRANDLVRALKVFPGRTYKVTLDAKDPCAATDEEIEELRGRFLHNTTQHG